MDAYAFAGYRAATGILEAGAPYFLARRMRRGKEDPERMGERLGFPSLPRPEGPLAWVHGASVGEGLALLPFIGRLAARGFRVLVTTGTVNSSRVLASRLPDWVLYQFCPLDLPHSAERFFSHWRPDLVCFAESELWPNLLGEARRTATPAILVNARMSKRSFARWRKAPILIRPLLGTFASVLAQSEGDALRLSRLGAKSVEHTGNLKFDVPPPSADNEELEKLRQAVGERPVWVAASTHDGEEAICCAAHRQVEASHPDLLTIIVPRQPQRGATVAGVARTLGLEACLRSEAAPIRPSTNVYVADTIGELGLIYRLASVVFVGKSLLPGGGGQNPIEPAKIGTAIMHGPHVANFEDVYAVLDEQGGGLSVADAEALARSLASLFADRETRDDMARRASLAVAACGGATDRIMSAIEPLCAKLIRPDRR